MGGQRQGWAGAGAAGLSPRRTPHVGLPGLEGSRGVQEGPSDQGLGLPPDQGGGTPAHGVQQGEQWPQEAGSPWMRSRPGTVRVGEEKASVRGAEKAPGQGVGCSSLSEPTLRQSPHSSAGDLSVCPGMLRLSPSGLPVPCLLPPDDPTPARDRPPMALSSRTPAPSGLSPGGPAL